MIADLVVRPLDWLPDDISELLGESVAVDHNLVRRLVADWVEGSNRFDRPGEIALAARIGVVSSVWAG